MAIWKNAIHKYVFAQKTLSEYMVIYFLSAEELPSNGIVLSEHVQLDAYIYLGD